MLIMSGLPIGVLFSEPPADTDAPPPSAAHVQSDDYVGYLSLRTEHFTFVYEPRDTDVVNRLATFADEAFEVLASLLQASSEPVTCLVNGRSASANGYFTPAPPAHISINIAAPTEPWIGADTDDTLRTVLIHELTHYFHIMGEDNTYDRAARFFGPATVTANLAFMPGWLVEGITTNTETMLTSGGRGSNPFFEMLVKAPIMDGTMFSIAEAGYSSYEAPRGRIYVAGYFFVRYFIDRYGMETFNRIQQDYLTAPNPWRLDRAVQRETGLSLRDHYDAMVDDLTGRFGTMPDDVPGSPASPSGDGAYYPPKASGDRIVYYRQLPNRRSALVEMREDGREAVILEVSLSDQSSFDLSGDRIVYAHLTADYAAPGFDRSFSRLAVLDLQSGRRHEVPHAGNLYQPVWWGDRIVALRATGELRELVAVDPHTGEVGVLFSDPNAVPFHPAVSPDGGQIAFALNRAGEQNLVVITPSDTPTTPPSGAEPPLGTEIDTGGQVFYPSFVDDGRLLVTVDRDGTLAIEELRLADGAMSTLIVDPVAGFDGHVVDGTIYYSAYRATGYTVRRHPLPTTSPVERAATSRPLGGVAHPTSENPAAPAGTFAMPHRERPILALWLPYPAVEVSETAIGRIGVGALTIGNSLLGRWSWTTDFAFYPVPGQITGEGAVVFAFGPVAASLGHIRRYFDDPYPFMDEYLDLSLSLTPLDIARYGRRTRVVLQSTLRYRRLVSGPVPFSVVDVYSSLPPAHQVFATGQVALNRSRFAFPWAYYRDRGARAAVYGQVPIEDGYAGYQPQVDLFLDATIPTPLTAVSLVATLAGAYGAGVPLPGYVEVRGFDDTVATLKGRVSARAELAFNIGPLDVSLAGRLPLLGMGLGLYGEYLGGFSLFPGHVHLPTRGYVGVELHGVFGMGTASLPLGVGLAARIDDAFDPTEDLRLYSSVSLPDLVGTGMVTTPDSFR